MSWRIAVERIRWRFDVDAASGQLPVQFVEILAQKEQGDIAVAFAQGRQIVGLVRCSVTVVPSI